MYRRRFHQPYIPVDSRSRIPPGSIVRIIQTDSQCIFLSGFHIRSQIKTVRSITIRPSADELPITATADAVYALLMKGVNLLDNQGDVRIVIANEVLETVSPSKTTVPGLGYIKRSFTQKNVVDARKIEVEKRNPGIAWGAVYAEYESPIKDVRQQGGELNVQKQLYVERMVNNAPQLQPITEKTVLQVGDKVVSRLSIRADRAMDFVQLKDQRGACFEPIGSVSGYNWSNGIGYYVDIKDASTNFFFDHLGKGVYVLEHSYRISRVGTYETGLATMQCAYAPEYASHSASMTIIIK